MVKNIRTGWLSPAGGGVGGGVLLCGGRSFLPLLICMAVLSVSGFLGNSSAYAAVDAYTKLLIHGDSMSDATGKTVTAYDNAAVSNAGKTRLIGKDKPIQESFFNLKRRIYDVEKNVYECCVSLLCGLVTGV